MRDRTLGWQSDADRVVNQLAGRYKVSRLVIAYRLVETGFADDRWYARVRPLYSVRPKAKGRGGPVPHVKALSRSGRSFAKLSLAAYRGGDITGGQLTTLLGLGLSHLPKIESELYATRHPSASVE